MVTTPGVFVNTKNGDFLLTQIDTENLNWMI